jgi:hypothetical protein
MAGIWEKTLVIGEPEHQTQVCESSPTARMPAFWDRSPSLLEPVPGQVARRSCLPLGQPKKQRDILGYDLEIIPIFKR